MKALVTGSSGFVGTNLKCLLSASGQYDDIYQFTRKESLSDLYELCQKADVVFHLAGVQRPDGNQSYHDNVALTKFIVESMAENMRGPTLVFSSSIQAKLDNEYGLAKRKEENLVFAYGHTSDACVLVYRFPNLFGRHSKPNYTSVVSTFCYNTCVDLPIVINGAGKILELAYVNDVLLEVLKDVSSGCSDANAIRLLPETIIHPVTLGELAYCMGRFKNEDYENGCVDAGLFAKLGEVYAWYDEQCRKGRL